VNENSGLFSRQKNTDLMVVMVNECDEIDVDLDTWQTLAEQVLSSEGLATCGVELTIHFVDEVAMTELNQTHMDSSGPTDVLAFPLLEPAEIAQLSGPGPQLLGDVVICPAVAFRQAEEILGRNAMDELALLLVHGILHLLGHDHYHPEERAVMEARQDEHLVKFLHG